MSKLSSNLYNAHGCRLVSKVRNSLKEVVRIESDFGKTLIDIATDFDSRGNLRKRIISKKTGKKSIERTVFTYEGAYNTRRKTVIEKFIKCNKIQTTVKSEILRKEEGKPYLTRIISVFTPLKNKSRKEVQLIEELSTGKHRRYIKTTARRLSDGKLINKTLEGNVDKLKELAKSHYLYFRGYSLKDFLISILPYAKILQKVENRYIDISFNSLTEKVAASSRTFMEGCGVVTFDMSKISSLSRVVDTVNHELRHQYQESIIEKYNEIGFRSLIRRVVNPFKYRYANRWKYEFENYISSKVDETKYLNQYIEIDARNSGEKARLEFLKETGLLDKLFPRSGELFTGNDEFFRLITPKA